MPAVKVKPQALVYGRTTLGANVPVLVDATGAVQIGGVGSGGTSSTYGAAFPAGGTAVGFKDSGGTLMQPGNLDASGNIKVNVAAGGAAGTNPSTATNSTKTASAASQTALSSNANRIGAEFSNDADSACYLKYGATASTTDWIIKLLPGERFTLPRAAYTGRIDCVWDTGPTGTLRISELSA